MSTHLTDWDSKAYLNGFRDVKFDQDNSSDRERD